MTVAAKTCTICREPKALETFGSNGGGRRRPYCKPCDAARTRALWEAKSPEARQAIARRNNELRKNRGGSAEWQRAYRQTNAAQIRESVRAYQGRRFFWMRARHLEGAGKATYQEIAALWKAQRGRCALTGRRLDRTAHLDHRHARKLGGGDAIANLQWVCADVNLAKRALSEADFVALCRDVIAEAARRAADPREDRGQGRSFGAVGAQTARRVGGDQ